MEVWGGFDVSVPAFLLQYSYVSAVWQVIARLSGKCFLGVYKLWINTGLMESDAARSDFYLRL